MTPRILTVGHACLDITYMVPNLPQANTKVAGASAKISIGGNAANAAAAICDLGARAELCSILGSESHPFTRLLVQLLASHGVKFSDCYFDEQEACSSSTIMVTPDGERSIINWQGPKSQRSITLPSDFKKYSMVMGDTYRLSMVKDCFTKAQELRIPTMLDVDNACESIDDVPYADHIWFSHDSWKKLKTPLESLQARWNNVTGITDGYRPVVWIGNDGIKKFCTPPSVDAGNTLGAGDVFRARLALGICLAESIDTAVYEACNTACDHITGNGIKPVIGEKS